MRKGTCHPDLCFRSQSRNYLLCETKLFQFREQEKGDCFLQKGVRNSHRERFPLPSTGDEGEALSFNSYACSLDVLLHIPARTSQEKLNICPAVGWSCNVQLLRNGNSLPRHPSQLISASKFSCLKCPEKATSFNCYIITYHVEVAHLFLVLWKQQISAPHNKIIF